MLTILLAPHARLPTCSATYMTRLPHCTEVTFVDSSEENIYITGKTAGQR